MPDEGLPDVQPLGEGAAAPVQRQALDVPDVPGNGHPAGDAQEARPAPIAMTTQTGRGICESCAAHDHDGCGGCYCSDHSPVHHPWMTKQSGGRDVLAHDLAQRTELDRYGHLLATAREEIHEQREVMESALNIANTGWQEAEARAERAEAAADQWEQRFIAEWNLRIKRDGELARAERERDDAVRAFQRIEDHDDCVQRADALERFKDAARSGCLRAGQPIDDRGVHHVGKGWAVRCIQPRICALLAALADEGGNE